MRKTLIFWAGKFLGLTLGIVLMSMSVFVSAVVLRIFWEVLVYGWTWGGLLTWF